jgi:UDP-glucose 4-epimerase
MLSWPTIDQNSVQVIAHFAAKIIVPDSIADPLGYYQANTAKTCSLLATTVATGVRQFIFSSTAAVYGEPAVVPVCEDVTPSPINPYGRSKLMSELILADAARAHDLRFVTLRYFNVAGADPLGRAGQSTPNATHLIKVACQAALGLRPYLEVFGTDYPTPDGSCLRDYIQVTDLIDAHMAALGYLTRGGHSLTLNCGYGRGYSVLDVIAAVKRVSGCDFEVRYADRRPRRPVGNRGEGRSHPAGARLEAPLRSSRHHRAPGARLGGSTQPDGARRAHARASVCGRSRLTQWTCTPPPRAAIIKIATAGGARVGETRHGEVARHSDLCRAGMSRCWR